MSAPKTRPADAGADVIVISRKTLELAQAVLAKAVAEGGAGMAEAYLDIRRALQTQKK